jgi:hypothetical protein
VAKKDIEAAGMKVLPPSTEKGVQVMFGGGSFSDSDGDKPDAEPDAAADQG